MSERLTTGRIVWAQIPDPNGIRKLRPAVIVTPYDQLSATRPFDVVAITSRLTDPLPQDHVLLPWHPRGHVRTGLNGIERVQVTGGEGDDLLDASALS